MRIAYIVSHPPTGIWQFVMATNEEDAKLWAFQQREVEFLHSAIEDNVKVDTIMSEMECHNIGEETPTGLYFYESKINIE